MPGGVAAVEAIEDVLGVLRRESLPGVGDSGVVQGLLAKLARGAATRPAEVIVAPDFEPEALEVFKLKKNLRVLRLPADWRQEPMDVRLLSGGLLLQDADRFPAEIESLVRGLAALAPKSVYTDGRYVALNATPAALYGEIRESLDVFDPELVAEYLDTVPKSSDGSEPDLEG